MIYKVIDSNTQECFVVGKKSDKGKVKSIDISEVFNGKGLHNDLTIREIKIVTDLAIIFKVYGSGITIYSTR